MENINIVMTKDHPLLTAEKIISVYLFFLPTSLHLIMKMPT